MRKFISDIITLLERGELRLRRNDRFDSGFRSQFLTVFTVFEDFYAYYLVVDKNERFVCGISSGLLFPKITTERHEGKHVIGISWTEYYSLKKFAEDVAKNSSFCDKISKMVEQSNSEIVKKF